MTNGTEYFKGTTKQAISDINGRLDRIEGKLDRVIEKNALVAAVSGGLTAVVVAIIALFANNK